MRASEFRKHFATGTYTMCKFCEVLRSLNILLRVEHYFNRLAILVLVINICVVSIPRCDSVFASLKHQLLHEDGRTALDCGQAVSPIHKGETIQNASLCRCSILKFLYFTDSALRMDRFIVFDRRLLLLIEFIEPLRLLSQTIQPDPPPPRQI